MSSLHNVNLNQVRVFECVYRTLSMTQAAKELHLTQSGVSQHIRTLEDMLGVPLFDRIKQRLIPTDSAKTFFEHCSRGLREIEQGVVELQGNETQLSGTVQIGMPIEFGNNVVMPLLASFLAAHPGVKVKIRLDFASAMNEALLKGDLDFAFIDDFRMDRSVSTERVFDEILELCGRADQVTAKQAASTDRAWFEKLGYVEYQENEPILRMWFAHHLGGRPLRLDVRAFVMDVQGMARLILHGAGIGVLPGYLVDRLEREGAKLQRFKGSGQPLKNKIQLAWLTDRTLSPPTRALLEHVRQGLSALPRA